MFGAGHGMLDTPKGGEGMEDTAITADRVLDELADIAFADLRAGTLPVKAADKLRALELIYRHLGMGDGAGGDEGVVIVDGE